MKACSRKQGWERYEEKTNMFHCCSSLIMIIWWLPGVVINSFRPLKVFSKVSWSTVEMNGHRKGGAQSPRPKGRGFLLRFKRTTYLTESGCATLFFYSMSSFFEGTLRLFIIQCTYYLVSGFNAFTKLISQYWIWVFVYLYTTKTCVFLSILSVSNT